MSNELIAPLITSLKEKNKEALSLVDPCFAKPGSRENQVSQAWEERWNQEA